MFLFKCIKCNGKKDREIELLADDDIDIEQGSYINDGIKLVYIACITPNQDIIHTLNSLTQDTIQVSLLFVSF
jgi:hypothetical protein